jgi:hypothetical protein
MAPRRVHDPTDCHLSAHGSVKTDAFKEFVALSKGVKHPVYIDPALLKHPHEGLKSVSHRYLLFLLFTHRMEPV